MDLKSLASPSHFAYQPGSSDVQAVHRDSVSYESVTQKQEFYLWENYSWIYIINTDNMAQWNKVLHIRYGMPNELDRQGEESNQNLFSSSWSKGMGKKQETYITKFPLFLHLKHLVQAIGLVECVRTPDLCSSLSIKSTVSSFLIRWNYLFKRIFGR